MTRLIFLFCLLTTGFAGAQDTASVALTDTLLSGHHWREAGTDYLLVLAVGGSFEEDAGEVFTRPNRYLMGRWSVDTAARSLTLSVDGLMASNLDPRYRKGRDYFVAYDVVSVGSDTLRLRDRLTNKVRTFTAQEAAAYIEPAFRRIPQSTDDGVFTLPKLGGGF